MDQNCNGNKCIQQKKRTLFKNNEQRSEEEGYKDYRLEPCIVFIGNLDTEIVRKRQIESF